jgi:hypothetical protein
MLTKVENAVKVEPVGEFAVPIDSLKRFVHGGVHVGKLDQLNIDGHLGGARA